MSKDWAVEIVAAAVLVCLFAAAFGALVLGPVSNGCSPFSLPSECPQVFFANGMAR
jgi:hypothetical protein